MADVMHMNTVHKTTCALCQKSAVLRNSHIIPELIYKPMYDSKHRFIQVDPKENRITQHQKGFREHLLCQQCETYLSKSENYVRGFLYGGEGFYARKEGVCSVLSGLNYHQVRIFFLSILWRMSVSALRIFESISLGPHQEHIRKMLLNDDAGEPDQYGFYAVIPVIEGEFFADLISEPDVIRFQNQRLYRVVIGGILYMFTVSKQPPPRPDLFIQKNGDWIFQYRDVRNVEFLRQGLEGVRKVKHPQ